MGQEARTDPNPFFLVAKRKTRHSAARFAPCLTGIGKRSLWSLGCAMICALGIRTSSGGSARSGERRAAPQQTKWNRLESGTVATSTAFQNAAGSNRGRLRPFGVVVKEDKHNQNIRERAG